MLRCEPRVRALSQRARGSTSRRGGNDADERPRQDRREHHPRGSRPRRGRLPGNGVACRERLAEGQRRRAAFGRGRHRAARLRPQPCGEKPRHQAKRIRRPRDPRADGPAVPRPVLPPPAPRRRRRACVTEPAARSPHAGQPLRRGTDRRLPQRRSRRRRPARQPPRRRPATGPPRRTRHPDRLRRATAARRGHQLCRRRQPRGRPAGGRPPDRKRSADHRDDRGAVRHGPRDRPSCRLSRGDRGRRTDAGRRAHRDRGLHPGGRRGCHDSSPPDPTGDRRGLLRVGPHGGRRAGVSPGSRSSGPGRRGDGRLRRLADRVDDTTRAYEHSATDRGDGPRDGGSPPRRDRSPRPGRAASRSRHRARPAGIERREARALRPAGDRRRASRLSIFGSDRDDGRTTDRRRRSTDMHLGRTGPNRIAPLAGVVLLVVAACGGTAPSASTAAPSPAAAAASTAASAAPSAAASPSESLLAITPAPVGVTGPNGGTVIRWFIGLGAGAQPQQVAAERKFADDYNASQKEIYLSTEIYDNKVAKDILQTQIAAGNPPDVIGPVGVEGLNLFRDQLLDLAPLVQSQSFDLSKIDPKLVDFWKMGANRSMIGVPYAVYPSFLWYNKALFDEAKLPTPPTKVGDTYQGKPWDTAALRDLAMKLTVDKSGNDATSPSFDAKNVVQWGYDMQFTDNSPIAESTLFGANLPISADGKTADIPAPLSAGMHWYDDGVWKDHFIPNNTQLNSDLLSKGSEFQSGNLAMVEGHSWLTCCVWPAAPAKPVVKSFGWAVAPSYNGTTTAKLHADTFSILKGSKHPDLAFKAVTALVDSDELLVDYGAFAADPSKQQSFVDAINTQFKGITLDWGVPRAMLAYPDIPNHQAFLPNYAKAKSALQAFWNKYRTTSGLDIDNELGSLKTTLQGVYDSAGT